jgi:hypothetical protein
VQPAQVEKNTPSWGCQGTLAQPLVIATGAEKLSGKQNEVSKRVLFGISEMNNLFYLIGIGTVDDNSNMVIYWLY